MDLLTKLRATLGVERCQPVVTLSPKTAVGIDAVLSRLVTSPLDGNPSGWTEAHIAVGPNEYIELQWEDGRWVDSLTPNHLAADGTLSQRHLLNRYTFDFRVTTTALAIPHGPIDTGDDDDDAYVEEEDDDDWYSDEDEVDF